MKQYEILWVPVDKESSPKSTRIETNCGTLDAIEHSIVLTIEELRETFVHAVECGEDKFETRDISQMFSDYITSKGITL